ncbi:TetR/AcrR family transcriptional regulator [Curtobacterium pusillum]|uniref:TetR/AcrR family transcriptional regulator n=1 Tax=Curtobacterium pusillum TaxID=69373 RepID=UPI0011A1FD08|nr:TetR family transcriptional regulator C-terminal domain-containing protein [Curtobacterium pusillum]
MPKHVDHQARRAEISSATWRVIERGGIPAVTLRSVAAEASISLGVLAHYFTSKDDILQDAHRAAYDRTLERVIERTRSLHGLQALRTSLLEALPLDDDRILEARVDVALVGATVTDDAIRAARAESADTLRRLILGCLAEARERGDLRPDTDDSLTADECAVLLDGASVLGLLRVDDASIRNRLIALVDAFIARISPDRTDAP